jgi:hypothetical protein
MTTATGPVAEIQATTALIKEATAEIRQMREEGQLLSTATTALIKDLADIALADADQETRERLVTEAADRFVAGGRRS